MEKIKCVPKDRNGIVGDFFCYITGRQTHRNRTSQEDDLKGRQPYKKALHEASQSRTELGPAQPQLVSRFNYQIQYYKKKISKFYTIQYF